MSEAEEDSLARKLASLKIDRRQTSFESVPVPRQKRSATPGTAPASGRSKLLLLSAGVAVLVLLIAGYFVFREGRGRMFPDEVEVGTVSLASPAVQDVTLVSTGYVYTRQKATIAPKVTGRVAKLNVAEGDKVTAGQIIAELESADPQAQLAQLRADVLAAKARAERARADVADVNAKVAREEQLLKSGAGTQSSYDDARARLASFQAQQSAADAEIRAVETRQQAVAVQLENTKVRAPFAGTVVRKLAEIGEVIAIGGPTGGSTGIITLAALDNLEVQADVSEAHFAQVKVGTPAEILLDAFPDRRFRGEVSEIRQTVDRAKASVTVKVKFSDPTDGVLPDMAAKVSFLSRPIDDEALKAAPKLVVPADAIVTRNGKPTVFVIDEGHVREVAITPGSTQGSTVEITTGPAAGTPLVRKPSPELHEGSPIKEKKK